MSFSRLTTFLMQLIGWKRQAMAFLAGAMTSFALAPFHFTLISFISFPILVIFLDQISQIESTKKRYRLAALTCWSFGFGYFVFGLWWLSNAMLVDPIAFAWAIPFSLFGLPAFLAIYWALAGVIACFLWSKTIGRYFALAFAIGLCEYFRGTLLTGFPWNSIGYTAMPTPLLMQAVAIFGLYGVNALAVLIYCLPTIFLTREKKQTAIVLFVFLILCDFGFGFYRLYGLPAADHATQDSKWVRIIQPSIEQTDKMDDDSRLAIFEDHIKLSTSPTNPDNPEISMIVWPETSVPFILDYVFAAKMRIASILKPNQWAIIGTVTANGPQEQQNKQYFNSIEALNGAGNIIATSNKVHLVPFGEYLPYQSFFDLIGLHAIAQTTGGYTPALYRKTVTLPNNFTYLPLICYEAIFPTPFEYSGQQPNAIINVTNDAWFGVTPGPYQHFEQVRIMAVEKGLPVIRAANNGISAVIDPYGRVVRSLKQNEIGVIDAPIPVKIEPIWNKGPQIYQIFTLFIILLLISLHNHQLTRLQSIDN